MYAPIVYASPQRRAWEALAQSRIRDAQRGFAAIVSARPDAADGWLGLTLAFARGGDRFAALGTARRAVAAGPDLIDARCVLAALQRQSGDLDGALATLAVARALDPEHTETLCLSADVNRRLRRLDDALDAAERACRREPKSHRSMNALADVLVACDRPDEAEALYRAVLIDDPRDLRAAFGLGQVALSRAHWHAAVSAFRRARAIDPDDPDVRYNLALLDLRFGRYRDGFAGYPSIMDTDAYGARYYYHHRGVPRWNGEPLAGRRLTISSDQGLGDALMMSRFLGALPAADPAIVVEAPAPLLRLLRRNFSNVRFEHVEHPQPASAMDLHLPITQLPCIARITTQTDIDGAAYLHADRRRLRRWRERLRTGGDGVRHVGIAWRGNPLHPSDARRSAPLPAWAPLAAVPGVNFHSLQIDATRAELAASPFALAPKHVALRDLDDTAALIGALDAVITVDTAIVHLAGALGRPVWLASALAGDYRWGIAGDSPWYTSLRIVRQTTAGDWTPVFAAIARALARG